MELRAGLVLRLGANEGLLAPSGKELGRRAGVGDVAILFTPSSSTVVRSSGRSLYSRLRQSRNKTNAIAIPQQKKSSARETKAISFMGKVHRTQIGGKRKKAAICICLHANVT